MIRHIYQHLIDEGWLKPGDVVCDPFSGVALGALHAMKHGLNWVGVELEQKFVDLGQQNIDLWNKRFGRLPGWGHAVILQGDSRRLVEVVGGAGGCVASPPFCQSDMRKGGSNLAVDKAIRTGRDPNSPSVRSCASPNPYGTDPANLGNMPEGKLADGCISSPPYAGGCSHTGGDDPKPEHIEGGELRYVDYGANEGQLGNMPEGEFDGVVASPPWGSGTATEDPNFLTPGEQGKLVPSKSNLPNYGTNPGQLANMPAGELDAVVASPPYAQALSGKTNQTERDRRHTESIGRDPDSPGAGYPRHYGASDGQLAALPEGEFDAVVSSPPYVGTQINPGNAQGAMTRRDRARGEVGGDSFTDHDKDGYGDADGQLATLPEGEFEAVVSSPPYEGSMSSPGSGIDWEKAHGSRWAENDEQRYSAAPENLGNQVNTTFWSAARQIVQQVYQVLAPGAPAVWVVKSFVRAGKRVDFPDQWRQLCESVGFETVHLHRAWLVEDRGSQFDLFGKVHKNSVERKSFFRRLHEFHASAKMYWNEHVTDRDTMAGYLWRAKAVLWAKYRYDLEKDKECLKPLIVPPTHSKIVLAAGVLAYTAAGKPWMDIPTRIDFEVILCQCKPT